MTHEEWLDRYAQRIVTVTGMDRKDADKIAAEADTDDCGMDDPEGAADDEMSYWEAD